MSHITRHFKDEKRAKLFLSTCKPDFVGKIEKKGDSYTVSLMGGASKSKQKPISRIYGQHMEGHRRDSGSSDL